MGIGTTICVRLPSARVPARRGPVAAKSDAATLEASLLRMPPPVEQENSAEADVSRALIIEDNQDLCRHMGELLGHEFECDFAHDGESGLQLGIDTVPDFIICDVMLPKMNGLEVVRQLKQDDRTCHIPVILLTARADEESRLAGLRTLADDYVTKPFSESELLQRVETLLSIREILRQRYAQQLHGRTQQPLPELGERDRRFLDRAGKALDENYSVPEFSLAQFASLLAMSERQLQRKFKALTNNSPREYIRSFRLDKAMSLLEAGQRVSDVAFSVGFTSQSYFATCFRAQFGMTPSQVRHPSDEQRAESAD